MKMLSHIWSDDHGACVWWAIGVASVSAATVSIAERSPCGPSMLLGSTPASSTTETL